MVANFDKTFDKNLFNLRILLETLENFEKFLENIINFLNCFDSFNKNLLSQIYYH